MSFFGFEQNEDDFEREKQAFHQGRHHSTGSGRQLQDLGLGERVPEFTWGEESYDGLGDALQEGGDELNNETFGGSGAVGKDFDFNQQTFGLDEPGPSGKDRLKDVGGGGVGLPAFFETTTTTMGLTPSAEVPPQVDYAQQAQPVARQPQPHSRWDEKSPFSVLPRMNGASRTPVGDLQRTTSSSRLSQYSNGSVPSSSQLQAATLNAAARTASPALSSAQQQVISQGFNQSGVRTLEEIEAEMRAAAQLSRASGLATQRQQLLQEQQQQQQQYYQQQQRSAPPRMHPQSQSPRFHQQQQQQQLLLQQQREQQLQQREREQQQALLEQQLLREQQIMREHQIRERERQRAMQLQELQLQEQLRMEELERQLRAQRISELQAQQLLQQQREREQQVAAAQFQQQHQQQHHQHQHQRQPSHQTLAELQAAQQIEQQRRRLGRASPATLAMDPHIQAAFQQLGVGTNGQLLPQNIQLQQRLLSELAQAEFLQNMQATTEEEQDALRAEAMRRIMETERMEEKRRRKAAKINHMSRYNDLMTQSDKDFITRIQVSQLVTQDPYAEDFYAQVYGALLRTRMGMQPSDDRVLKFGSGGGVGLGLGQKGAGRRQSAMQKMEQQVERIVNNARLREKEKNMHSLHSLQGALGKTSGRSYKAAPRQLLQVAAGNANGAGSPSTSHAHISREDAIRTEGEGAAKEAARLGAEALGVADPNSTVAKDPLTLKETLAILEHAYDLTLRIEQLQRDQPPADSEDFEEIGIWSAQYNEFVQQLYDELRVMEALETSTPHPFISVITPVKGKKLLARIAKHFSHDQMMTILTLIVACVSQLDVVVNASLLDTPLPSHEQSDVERQTNAFLDSIIKCIMPVFTKARLRLISGMLGLMLERSDVTSVAQTRPGMALLTLFMTRVQLIKEGDPNAPFTDEELNQWQRIFDHFFQLLHPVFPLLFPSTRLSISVAALSQPPHNLNQQELQQHIANLQARETLDSLDRSVWHFFATLSVHCTDEQKEMLVTVLRDKVLETVESAMKWAQDEEEREIKLANVNTFLVAIGLHSSYVTV